MRLRPRRDGLPEHARDVVERDLAVWRLLDEDERERLLEIADRLLSGKRWEGHASSRSTTPSAS